MPKDYSLNVTPPNDQRRPQNAMDDEWTRQFLLRAEIGHVATLWDDQPFITPTNFCYDPQRHEIYFHSNVVGRVRANAERHERACFEASEFGRYLPSNVALEFSIQYQSAVVFGKIRVLEDDGEKRQVLVALIGKYFSNDDARKRIPPDHRAGIEAHQRLCHRRRKLERQTQLEGSRGTERRVGGVGDRHYKKSPQIVS